MVSEIRVTTLELIGTGNTFALTTVDISIAGGGGGGSEKLVSAVSSASATAIIIQKQVLDLLPLSHKLLKDLHIKWVDIY